ncbi:sulfatase-like hydrolase/transferase [Agaribacter marinus]|uniref:Sulfatase N-terminal domain-containing protein n=1 Tax=Agaribacter marinus TaxID=1431249 RepID=A0AA37WIQ0_9ALTE|nr:sulfatase-like hydrolase/transferase [Agaribacter marinus]GLR71312.1 hypothetical protein GCM10007852_22200 [Agaribacter marinus]
MLFWLGFVSINIFCFLPYYLINIRQQANPFSFLTEKRVRHRKLHQLLFSKLEFSDPFRINAEFSLILLILLIFKTPLSVTVYISTGILLISQIYIVYLSVMIFVFSRTPAFLSDLSLINTGIIIFKSRAVALIIGLICFIGLLGYLAFHVNQWLIITYYNSAFLLQNTVTILVLLTIVIFGLLDWKKRTTLALLDWRKYRYKDLHWRNVFSTTHHLIRNIMFCKKYKTILLQSKASFQQKNLFSKVKLKRQPNFVFICVESYGARVYKDPKLAMHLESTIQNYREKFSHAGLHVASHFSTSPIFSGGSWLSYTTFMYGTKVENIQLYDTLFESTNNFSEYESIFHFMHRNGYHNLLCCPMGGVSDKDINWDPIKRCFQPDDIVDWKKLDFTGKKIPFFGLQKRFCAPDQYVINHGYERAKSQIEKPVCVFYCTMNSHIPWISPTKVVEDWRSINTLDYMPELSTDTMKSNHDKYLASINYQLSSVFDFALNNQDDDMVLVVFGDHQPPLIAIPRMGLETPVHIISKNEPFIDTFKHYGFKKTMNLRGHKSHIKHEGFMSIFATACNQILGEDPSLDLPILSNGVELNEVNDSTD